jgi:hypothetical protein
VLLEGFVGRGPRVYAAVRTEGYKYVEYGNGEEELYDLSADPYELENIYDSVDPPSSKISRRGWRRSGTALAMSVARQRTPRSTGTGETVSKRGVCPGRGREESSRTI